METGGGLGFSNCSYGFGLGNAAGYGTAGYGGLFCFESEKAPAMECEPEERGLELELALMEVTL